MLVLITTLAVKDDNIRSKVVLEDFPDYVQAHKKTLDWLLTTYPESEGWKMHTVVIDRPSITHTNP